MKFLNVFFACSVAIAGLCLAACDEKNDNAQYVDALIGTAGTGHTYPGVVAPFGMVQPSPETGYQGWQYCSGYNYGDGRILSFGQTHLSGTGCPDSGDAAFMPFTGNPVKKDYSSAFEKKNETAELGKYSVVLDDAKARVELTANETVALYRIKYLADNGGIFFDFQTGMMGNIANRVVESDIKLADEYTIVGTQKVRAFTRRDISFAVKFDKPVRELIEIERPKNHKAPRWSLLFGLKSGDELKVKISVSTVGIDGALKNLSALEHWDFDNVAKRTREQWNAILSRISVDAPAERKKIFYTALYHSFISPNNIADIDGRYRGADGKIADSSNASKKYYTNLSLWDTYRAVVPLTSIIFPDILPEFANSMLDHYDATGVLPTNAYWGKETWCMIGNHAISVISGCIQRGQKGFDYGRAFEAMLSSSVKNHNKSDFTTLEKYGYYPFDLVKVESVSKTLENCYGDYCLSLAAKALGKADVAEKFGKRSKFYKNIFDSELGFMRGKDSKGEWRKPFNPFEYSHGETFGGDYTEGNAWQYNFHVQHDTENLIELFGGREKFVKMLDKLFETKDARKDGTYRKSQDVTGLIGQYAHGNEPSHHVAYLYALAGRPDKTADLVGRICDELYTGAPDGLCGNDDCGQMSAWYVFSSLGFYPVNPNGLEYVLGAPQVKRAEIRLPNGKKFEIAAHNFSAENRRVKSVKLNGEEYRKTSISHADIVKGGKLEFFMGSK